MELVIGSLTDRSTYGRPRRGGGGAGEGGGERRRRSEEEAGEAGEAGERRVGRLAGSAEQLLHHPPLVAEGFCLVRPTSDDEQLHEQLEQLVLPAVRRRGRRRTGNCTRCTRRA